MNASPTHSPPPGAVDYVAVEHSAPFQELKRKHRSFVWPLTIVFLVWYFVYVLLSSFATDFMAQRVWGDITVGLLFGLGQFVTTFAITMGYVWYANHKLDPISASIRRDLERQEAGS
ncbi:DUF485 domain-containing protein [Microbacterium arborescens]|jgi:uncharacterized membrane protein (DUF485 family)|uniref:DUF485 domain-containing protein n=1 Tax=Microbacterium TaxID=33882 RepID=UPI0025A248F0|nr:DUF485 domain-containing protein [Microbacterium arborescens]MDF2579488.1 hypothetical protein [Microbacterium sp.]WJM14604.1 DUF485 domain-containing protein [Microbacterium arborescens]